MTEKTVSGKTFRATCASPDAALAHALEPLWCEDQKGPEARGHPRVAARLLRALEADGAAGRRAASPPAPTPSRENGTRLGRLFFYY